MVSYLLGEEILFEEQLRPPLLQPERLGAAVGWGGMHAREYNGDGMHVRYRRDCMDARRTQGRLQGRGKRRRRR